MCAMAIRILIPMTVFVRKGNNSHNDSHIGAVDTRLGHSYHNQASCDMPSNKDMFRDSAISTGGITSENGASNHVPISQTIESMKNSLPKSLRGLVGKLPQVVNANRILNAESVRSSDESDSDLDKSDDANESSSNISLSTCVSHISGWDEI